MTFVHPVLCVGGAQCRPGRHLGCLRMDWPRALFTFMGRHHLDPEHLRSECRECFGSTQSGLCTFCGKYIQQNLGRHVTCYHMNLAQLWWCPVTWCTVWRGTHQDCIDHMRKADNIPATVKMANLACWFPPWTVSREQWTIIMRSSVGVNWCAVVSSVSCF